MNFAVFAGKVLGFDIDGLVKQHNSHQLSGQQQWRGEKYWALRLSSEGPRWQLGFELRFKGKFYSSDFKD
jgi:hypothetical protein